MSPEAIGEATEEATGTVTDNEIQALCGSIARKRVAAGDAIGEETGGLAAGGYDEIRDGDGEEAVVPSHRRWEVTYEDSTIESPRVLHGFISLHLPSLWITVRDAEDDILAGRYLQKRECPRVGHVLEIDGFRLIVRNPSSPEIQEKAAVCVDLTSPPTRFGRRFWVLAYQDDEEDAGHSGVIQIDEPTPLPCWVLPAAESQERKIQPDFKLAK